MILKSDREINYLRDAGRIVAETLVEIKKAVKPDVTALELEQTAEKYKRFISFPVSMTSLVSQEVMFGNPGLRKLNFGDNVNINNGTVFDRSMHEDSQMPKAWRTWSRAKIKNRYDLCAGDGGILTEF